MFDRIKFGFLLQMHLRKKYGWFNFGIHHPHHSVQIFKKLTKFPHFGLMQRISYKPFLGQLMVLETIAPMALPLTIPQPILCLDRQNQVLSILSLTALRAIFDEKLGILDLGSSHQILCSRFHVICVRTSSNFFAVSARKTLFCQERPQKKFKIQISSTLQTPKSTPLRSLRK